jgi:hypothetical protein
MIARYFARRWGGLAYELVIGLAVVGFLMLAALAMIASVVVLAVIGILGSLVWFAVIPRDVRHGWVLDFRGGTARRRTAAAGCRAQGAQADQARAEPLVDGVARRGQTRTSPGAHGVSQLRARRLGSLQFVRLDVCPDQRPIRLPLLRR